MLEENGIAILDFGGQYTHLIANRIRRLGTFSEILEPDVPVEALQNFAGIIFSGGPGSVYSPDPPPFNEKILIISQPKLGICYGHQLICKLLGGEVHRGKVHEFGNATLEPDSNNPLFHGIEQTIEVWMSHGDEVEELPQGFRHIGSTINCQAAAVANELRKIYGIQFHPEVTHTEKGNQILENFLNICHAARNWNMENFLPELSQRLREQTGDKKVFLLVSGGVDSTVAFALLNHALGTEKVLGLHIDTGLMRHEESTDIMEFLKKEGFDNLRICEASETFLKNLEEVSDPEKKRAIIGETFLQIKDEELAKLKLNPEDWILAQGTIYPDTIESGGTKNSATIKTHHNRVPGIRKLMEEGRIIEPLSELYKDEVRDLGETMGIPHHLVWRHPFPGPGLGVRLLCHSPIDGDWSPTHLEEIEHWVRQNDLDGEVLPVRSVGVQGDSRTYAHPLLIRGASDWKWMSRISTEATNSLRSINRVVLEIGVLDGDFELVNQFCTRENLEFLRMADHLCTTFLRSNDLYDEIWQMPVVMLPLRKQGKPVMVVRPVASTEAMTARFFPVAVDLLVELWQELKNAGVGGLLFDVTNKPPGTIEWE